MPRYINVEWLMEKIKEREYPLDCDPLSTLYGLSTLGILRILEEAPTVSPDEVRGVGKWICFTKHFVKQYDDKGVEMMRCSVCDYTTFASSRSPKNYCPSCGAKMEASEDA